MLNLNRLRLHHRPIPNRRPPRRPWHVRLWDEVKIGCYTATCFLIIGILYPTVAAYITCLFITIGQLKFCFSCAGKRDVFFTQEMLGERGERDFIQSPVNFHFIRALSIVLFPVALKLLFTLPWGNIIKLSVSVRFTTTTGFLLDGSVRRTVNNVLELSFHHSWYEW